jgi:predicted  nucleic acid-binding Zn-ribbon protein
MDSQTWATIILALIAASPGIYAVWKQQRKDIAAARKDTADASESITNSAVKLIEPLNKEIDKLKARVVELESKVIHQDEVIHKFVVGTKRLQKQLLDHGMNPVWQPATLEAEIK